MGNEYILDIRDISKHFGGIKATNHVSLGVKPGEIFGVIGPNGAGKTTLFNLITGIYAPSEGDILLEGSSIVGRQPNEIANLGIARTFQNIRLFNDLTVYENVHIAYQQNMNYSFWDGVFKTPKCRREEQKAAEVCEQTLRRVGLWDLRDQIASNLPYGQQRRLEIVCSLVCAPKVLLLDEPAAGMNEGESEELSQIIRNIRVDHPQIAILVIDHHMDVIMNVCDRLTVINFGKQLATGLPEEIQANEDVIEAYLGAGD